MIGRLFAFAPILALAFTACSHNPSRLDELGDGQTATLGRGAPGSKATKPPPHPDAPPTRAAVTAKTIAPIIHELGVADVVPTDVVISLATAVIDRDDVGQVSSGSVFKVVPETAGSLKYTGTSELTFTPAKPFEFDTTYKVELAKLETRDGVIAPGAGEQWTHEFKTPSFKFLGWAPTDLQVDKHKVTMEITFSGAVLPNKAFTALGFAIDGKPTTAANVLASRAQNVLTVQLTDPRIVMGSKLALTVKPTLSSYTGAAKAAAATASYTIADADAVSIKTVAVVEGANGFYLEVVCDDGAAATGERSYYETESYYNLSERCQLTDEAIAKIHFTPAVKKAYITPGRAGFRVFGDFKRGTYAIKIDSGARSVDGGVVLATYARSFSVSARKPQLSFASSGRYLPRSAWGNLGIKHLNMDGVNLIVRHVPPENLVFWLGNQGSDQADERTSNVLLRKTIPLKGDPDSSTMSWIDVGSLVPTTTKGVIEIKVVGVGGQATSRLLLTDMSLVAKKTTTPGKPWDQQVQVWALDMETAGLEDGVDVSLVRKSGKTVARCTTSGGQGCKLATSGDDPDQAEPFALIARQGDDLTYIRYQDLRADLAESSTAGIPYVSDTPYRAAVFSDRGVYRPGDTANVTAIVRDAKDRAPDQALPIDVKVIDPRAKVVRKVTLKTNPGGVITLAHALPAFADTGHWRVQLSVADKALAAYDVQVEEFVPERMKVTATPKQTDVLIGDEVKLGITASYLFGGNAMDSGVELSCSVEPARFAPEANGDLTYGVEPKGKAVNLGQVRDQLDPKGEVTMACADVDEDTAFTQTAELTASVAVLEAGSGRATVDQAIVMLHPEKYYLGVRTKAARAAAGKAFTVEGLVVDWNGKPVLSAVKDVKIELAHLEADYGYGYDEETGESRYDRNLRTVPEGKLDAKVIDGKFTFDVTPGESGAGYVVRILAGKAKTELVLDGEYPYEYYGYGDGGHVDSTPRPARPTKLAVTLPRDIEAGKPTTVKIKAPYKGRVLWTVETDRVVTAEWQDIAAGESTWSFTLAKYAPNVYVSAFVAKDPHLESRDAFLPDRAFGIASARVTPTAFTQPVTIEAPKEVRSSAALPITLNLGAQAGPTFAVVAVVDEGILSLTGFQTPDPLAQLFAKRALGVETYETIGWTMLHQPAGASSKTGGGDGDYDEGAEAGALGAGRVQPVKPVSLFSGIVAVGADGKVTIPFQLPSYRGQLRVMAITASATRIGRAEATVTVKDPLVIQTTFPRFVTQNDELQIPVFLTNMSGGPLEIVVTLDSTSLAIAGLAAPKTATAPITFAGKNTTTLKLDTGRAETIVFQAKATMPVGGAKLRVVAKAKGLAGAFEVIDELEVPFLPSGPKERAIQKFKVEAGKLDLSAKAPLKNWMPLSEQTTFWLTANPYGESFEHLSYLIHYPYGCIEQTVSSTRPLLYVANIVEQVDPALAEMKIEDMVLAGINRIFSMETPSGGFGYWPGSTEPLEWATAYATHMLLDAKKAGYAISDERLANVLTWIENRLAQYERGGTIQRQPWNHYDEQSEAYLHYVLALAGKGKKARIQALVTQIPATSKGELAENRYTLQAALYLAGDRRYATDLKAVDTSPIGAERVNSWSFYSERRRRGLMLSTFHDLFGNDAAGELLATRVAEVLTGQASGYYNTQELVWGVTGLGKWVQGQATKATADGTLVADGTTIKARATHAARSKQQSNDKSWSLLRASEYKSLTLDVPASAAGLWLVVRSEGVRPNGEYKVGGNGLTVTRNYKQLDGTDVALGDGSLKLGDLVFVEVEVSNTTGVAIQNIALVDRLPAGFEVENPRLGRSMKADWIKPDEAWGVDFLNMRDDRLEAFGTLLPNESRTIVYTVRVVTAGKFTIPPVEAEAMYDPTLWAREKGATAVVSGPWTGKTI